MINLETLSIDLPNYIAMLGEAQDLINNHQEARIAIYEKLIAGAIACRAKKKYLVIHKSDDPYGAEFTFDPIIPIIKAIIEWLRTNDFYNGPASTKYHEAFNGGLLHHSLQVYNKMIELHQIHDFNQVDIGSAAFVALTHDWCKIGKYECYTKNVKNPDTKQWEEQTAYKYADKYMGLGHGPQSLMMVSQFCTTGLTSLTFDEMAAIRWHMYTYDVTSFDVDDLNKCGNQIPLVKLTQFADQLALCIW